MQAEHTLASAARASLSPERPMTRAREASRPPNVRRRRRKRPSRSSNRSTQQLNGHRPKRKTDCGGGTRVVGRGEKRTSGRNARRPRGTCTGINGSGSTGAGTHHGQLGTKIGTAERNPSPANRASCRTDRLARSRNTRQRARHDTRYRGYGRRWSRTTERRNENRRSWPRHGE